MVSRCCTFSFKKKKSSGQLDDDGPITFRYKLRCYFQMLYSIQTQQQQPIGPPVITWAFCLLSTLLPIGCYGFNKVIHSRIERKKKLVHTATSRLTCKNMTVIHARITYSKWIIAEMTWPIFIQGRYIIEWQ